MGVKIWSIGLHVVGIGLGLWLAIVTFHALMR
jgi:hypothetical protein